MAGRPLIHSTPHTHTQLKESIGDRLHYFVEECDSLQGFHLLVDQDDGFGGLGGCLVAELADEFSQKGVLAVPLCPRTSPLDQVSGWVGNGVVIFFKFFNTCRAG